MCIEKNIHITQTDIEVHLEIGCSFNSGDENGSSSLLFQVLQLQVLFTRL